MLDISAELICISETPHHTSLSRHTRNTRDIAAEMLQTLSQLSLSVLLFLFGVFVWLAKILKVARRL